MGSTCERRKNVFTPILHYFDLTNRKNEQTNGRVNESEGANQ